jgi:hypothetical protein
MNSKEYDDTEFIAQRLCLLLGPAVFKRSYPMVGCLLMLLAVLVLCAPFLLVNDHYFMWDTMEEVDRRGRHFF